MKKLLLVVVFVVLALAPAYARAESCDPLFSGAKFYQCKAIRKPVTAGLVTEERLLCEEYKELKVSGGCLVTGLVGDYNMTLGGKKVLKNSILVTLPKNVDRNVLSDWEWQCSPEEAQLQGGLKAGAGNITDIVPGYTPADLPGLSNDDRARKWETDHKDVQIFQIVELNGLRSGNATKQICQWFNVKKNTIAARFEADLKVR